MIKLVLTFLFCIVSFNALAEVSSDLLPEKWFGWVEKAGIWIGLAVLVLEYLIAESKLKSNSVIEMVLKALKWLKGKKK